MTANNHMSVKEWGIGVMAMGVLAFILPFFNLQLKIIYIFGSYQWLVAIIAFIIGTLLTILGVILDHDKKVRARKIQHTQQMLNK